MRSDNPNAIAFHSALGFERVGALRAHALVRGRYLDEVLMERLI